MHAHTVLKKTDQGIEAIKHRDRALPPRERTTLILVDGSKRLQDLAQACGVDRFRLTRAFKAAFGLAPHAYLVQLRLAHARRLLDIQAEAQVQGLEPEQELLSQAQENRRTGS